MSKYRPKHPAPDGNHSLAPKALRGVWGATYKHEAYYTQIDGKKVVLRDSSKLGGSFLDWQLMVGNIHADIEIKMPKKKSNFTDGEEYFMENSESRFFVITTEQEFIDLVQALVVESKQ